MVKGAHLFFFFYTRVVSEVSTPPCTGYVRSGLKGKKMKKLNPPQVSQISKGQRSGTAWRKFLVNIDLIHNSKFRSLKTELWKQTANSEALLVNFFLCVHVCAPYTSTARAPRFSRRSVVAAETSCTAFGSDLTSFCEKEEKQ